MSSGSSPITISTLKFMNPQQLRNELASKNPKIAVIDVRDNDHIGGHIRGSQWVPTNQLEARMPELLRLNAGKDKVVFHCMLSQQRGPRAALAYARAKAREIEKHKKDSTGNAVNSDDFLGGQQVCVLEGGFSSWQNEYGEDEVLTEAYQKDLWELELV